MGCGNEIAQQQAVCSREHRLQLQHLLEKTIRRAVALGLAIQLGTWENIDALQLLEVQHVTP